MWCLHSKSFLLNFSPIRSPKNILVLHPLPSLNYTQHGQSVLLLFLPHVRLHSAELSVQTLTVLFLPRLPPYGYMPPLDCSEASPLWLSHSGYYHCFHSFFLNVFSALWEGWFIVLRKYCDLGSKSLAFWNSIRVPLHPENKTRKTLFLYLQWVQFSSSSSSFR